MKSAITPAYVFDASMQTLDLSMVSGFTLKKLYAVINATRGKLYYAAGDSNYVATNAAGILSMPRVDAVNDQDSDQLLIIYEADASSTPTAVTLPNQSALTYNQAGVIAVNTNLMTIDCQGASAVSVQLSSIGAGGVITPFWSNDNVNFVAGSTLVTTQGAPAATLAAAGLWVTAVYGRYLQLRLTTATTAGTTTLAVQNIPLPTDLPLALQTISGAVTITSGSATAVFSNSGALASSAASAKSKARIMSLATVNYTLVKASAGRLYGIHVANTNTYAVYLKFFNKATAPISSDTPVATYMIPAGQRVDIDDLHGFSYSTGLGYSITKLAADADATVVAVNDLVGELFYV